MAEVLLFHHAQGLTDGIRAFADDLRAAGHTVHTPDLYDGLTFPTVEEGVPVQVHGMDADPWFVDEGDIDAARALVESSPDAALFLYPGDQHLFADASLASYDREAADLLTQRVLEFLGQVDAARGTLPASRIRHSCGASPPGGGWPHRPGPGPRPRHHRSPAAAR